MNVLILGASGMLGSAVFNVLSEDDDLNVWGSVRSRGVLRHFPESLRSHLLCGIDVLDEDALIRVFGDVKPDVVVNCVGLIKQLSDADDPLCALPINSMLPHRLERLCRLAGARLVHISTDCVFSGSKGGYLESDNSDAYDLYGKSKYIGELSGSPHAVTLRTSIIGHELDSNYALVEWFLSQSGSVKGYTNAIFSGLPTVELARIIRDYVIPNESLCGLYHVSADPIDKYSLLKLIASEYGKDIEIISDDAVKIDRSLDSSRFREATGYIPPSWNELVQLMRGRR